MTDGEFNSLRSMGANGPTNVLQIKADCTRPSRARATKTVVAVKFVSGENTPNIVSISVNETRLLLVCLIATDMDELEIVKISDDSESDREVEADNAPAYILCLEDKNWLNDEVRNESDVKTLGQIKLDISYTYSYSYNYGLSHIGKYGTELSKK